MPPRVLHHRRAVRTRILDYYVAHRDEFGYGQDVVDRLNDYIARNLETLRRAARAGVTIAMGSDAFFTGFGENTRGLEMFVKARG